VGIISGGGKPVRLNRKTRLVELEVVRDSDFGVNDTRFYTVSHLGSVLHVGDTALGYDLTSAVFNDADIQSLEQSGISLPDVIIVKKQYPRNSQVLCALEISKGKAKMLFYRNVIVTGS
jgi:nonsense-mediated mRNA decay protein 3